MCSVPAAAARTKPVDAAAASSDSSGPVSFLKVLPFSFYSLFFLFEVCVDSESRQLFVC